MTQKFQFILSRIKPTASDSRLVAVLAAIIGLFVGIEQYYFSLLLAPIVFAHLVRKNFNWADGALRAFGFVFLAFFFAMAPFLTVAIRQFAQTSLLISLLLSFAILIFNSIAYVLPLLSFAFRNSKIGFPLAVISLSCAGAFWPNMGNLGLGETLAQYELFQPFIRLTGTTLATALAMSVALGATGFALSGYLRRGLALLALFSIVVGWSWWMDGRFNPSITVRSNLRMALVQAQNQSSSIEKGEVVVSTNVDVAKKLFDEVEKHLNANPADLIVLPEGGLEADLTFPWDSQVTKRLALNGFVGLGDLLNRHQAGLISEGTTRAIGNSGELLNHWIPAAYLYSSHFAHINDFSFKSSLIPFVEYVPGGQSYPRLKAIFPWAWSDPSEIPPRSFVVNRVRFRPIICYDALFASSYYSAISDGAEFMVSLTNNIYLNRGSHYQYAIAKARTVEFGMPLIYVGNFADTGVINDGVNSRMPAGHFGILAVDTSHLVRRLTFYSTHLYQCLEPLTAWFPIILAIGIVCFGLIWTIKIWQLHRTLILSLVEGYIGPLAIALGAYFGATQLLVQLIYIPTSSMWPTIIPGGRALICRYRTSVHRGDIVSVILPKTGNAQVIKRIILLPGEQLLPGGRIRKVTGEIIAANYERKIDRCIESVGENSWPIACDGIGSLSTFETETLPNNSFFVLGDNRNNSFDSRKAGPVDRSKIKGVVCLGPWD